MRNWALYTPVPARCAYLGRLSSKTRRLAAATLQLIDLPKAVARGIVVTCPSLGLERTLCPLDCTRVDSSTRQELTFVTTPDCDNGVHLYHHIRSGLWLIEGSQAPATVTAPSSASCPTGTARETGTEAEIETETARASLARTVHAPARARAATGLRVPSRCSINISGCLPSPISPSSRKGASYLVTYCARG
jgi:hypothetical protein